MRISLLALALVLVTGCTSTPPAPVLPDVVAPTITTSQVVVTRSCVVDIPVAPAWATEAAGAGLDEFTRMRALLAEREQRRIYVPRLEALIRACQ